MSERFSKERNISGILYAEDFGENSKEKIEKTENVCIPPNLEKEKFISEDLLEEFYQKGIQEGKKIERELLNVEKEKISNDLYDYLLGIFSSIEKEFSDEKKKISENISSIIVMSAIKIFPNLNEEYGEKESEKIFQKIHSLISKKLNINISCSNKLYCIIKEILSNFPENKLIFNIDENIKNGDFKIVWDTGSLSRSVDEDIKSIVSEIFSPT